MDPIENTSAGVVTGHSPPTKAKRKPAKKTKAKKSKSPKHKPTKRKAPKTAKRKPAKRKAKKAGKSKPTRAVVRTERLDMRLSKAEKAKVTAVAKRRKQTITVVVYEAIARLK